LKKIPVYDIQTISCKSSKIGQFEILPFEEHLKRIDGIRFPHRHDFYYLLFITSGKGTHTIDFKTYPVTKNQLFFMSPGQVHQWDIKPGTKGFTLFFDKALFDYTNFKIEEEWSFFHNFIDEASFIVPKAQQKPLTDWFSWVLKEYTASTQHQDHIIKHLVSALLYKINDTVSSHKTTANTTSKGIIRKFELLIDDHFLTEHQLAFYANKLCVSANYLNALCQKTLAKSAKELINQRLLLESKRLLQHSSMPVNDLSDYLNFHSPSYFIRFFKKHEDMTPVAFKTKNS
jgi:AraC family transcriptional regulator, transcriptional activator of pobA